MKDTTKKLITSLLLGLFIITGVTYGQNKTNNLIDKEVSIYVSDMKVHHMKMNNITMNDSINSIMTDKTVNETMMDSCKMMMNNPEHKTMMGNMKDHMKMNKAMMDSCKMMMMKDPEHKKKMKNMKGKMKMHDNSKMKSSMKTKMKNRSSIVRKGVIDLVAIDKNKDGKVFQDVMDWNVISDKPGTCPLCGMKLKEVTLEKAKENLLKNGFKVR